MTTGEIATYANLDRIKGALPDVNVQFIIRHKLVYDFIHDIGYPSWARRNTTATLVSSNNYFDITSVDDFRQMRKLMVAPDYETEVPYIGDQEAKIFAAQAETTPGGPTGFWIGSDGSHFRRVFVDRPADQNYTMALSYYRLIPFTNETDTSFELDPYIPRELQWPLVELLKKYYYSERFGIDDNRTQLAESEYQAGIARIRENPEKSSGAKFAYMT
jgi:hypothetical protein